MITKALVNALLPGLSTLICLLGCILSYLRLSHSEETNGWDFIALGWLLLSTVYVSVILIALALYWYQSLPSGLQ